MQALLFQRDNDFQCGRVLTDFGAFWSILCLSPGGVVVLTAGCDHNIKVLQQIRDDR